MHTLLKNSTSKGQLLSSPGLRALAGQTFAFPYSLLAFYCHQYLLGPRDKKAGAARADG